MAILLTEDARPFTITDGDLSLAGDIDTGRTMTWNIRVSAHPQSSRMPATSGRVIDGRTGSVSMVVSDVGGDDTETGPRSTAIIDKINQLVRSAGRFRIVTDSWEVLEVLLTKVSWSERAGEKAADVSIDWQEVEIVDAQILEKPGEMIRRGRRKARALPVTDFEYVATNDLIHGNVVQP